MDQPVTRHDIRHKTHSVNWKRIKPPYRVYLIWWTIWTDAVLTCRLALTGPLCTCSNRECSSPGGWWCRDRPCCCESTCIRWWGTCAPGWRRLCSCSCSSSCLCLSSSFSHLCWDVTLSEGTKNNVLVTFYPFGPVFLSLFLRIPKNTCWS